MQYAPPSIWKRLILSLNDPFQISYGQIATVNRSGKPEVRTVHLLYSKPLDALIFNTHASTLKFAQMKERGVIAGCLFDPKRSVQFRWKGRVRFLQRPRSLDEEKNLSSAWQRIGPSVRKAYWRERGEEESIEKRCPDSVTVLCLPTWWDIYDLHRTDYSRGKRQRSVLTKGRWRTTRISVLTGKPAKS